MKKQPMRMCTGCGEMIEKKNLIRVVKNSEGMIFIDLKGKENGRGAYLCDNIDCLKKARKNRRIERSFKCKIPDEIFEQMEKDIAHDE